MSNLKNITCFASRFCLFFIATAMFITVANQPSLADADERRPNVLFIAIDDLRCDLGCFGAEHVQSPNIDKFATTSVTFTRAYVQQSVCNPSRVSIMTGMRPDSTRVWDLRTRFRTTIPDAVTLPQHFRKQGYHAVSFGKIFHNPWPDNASWDEPHQWPENASLWSDDAKQRLVEFRKSVRAAGKSEAAVKRIRAIATEAVDIEDSEHIDGAIADQAIAAMRRLAKTKQPFFLASGFVRPHLPFVTPKKYWELYDREKVAIADNQFFPQGMPPMAFGDRSRGGIYELADYMDYADIPTPFKGSLTEAQQRELRHGYYASISFIDAQVGRLLNELNELELADDTIVVLWSDHGWKLGEHNGWCKQTNFEIDTRAPLVIRVPGAEANGQACDSLVEFIDIYPTLCKLAELPVPFELEGNSLAPLLQDATAKVKDAAFSQFPRTHNDCQYMGYAMRTERYRYIEWVDQLSGKTAGRELYDHQKDPAENINVVDDDANAKVVEAHHERLWRQFDKTIFVNKGTGKKGKQAKAKPPNILFLMADDWSWPHAGACGDPVVATPTFDRISREGVHFSNAFVSSPSCTPSRMAVATGQFHWRLDEAKNLGGSLAKGVPVYPELLQNAGYEIGHARKGATPSKHKFTGRDPFGPRFRSFEAFYEQRKPDQPFCFWYGAGEPHRPYRFGEGAKAGIDPDAVRLPACLPDNETTRNDFADYLHRIQNFDTYCGKIVAKLKASGELENTIVVISGDNGLPFPRCKATLYDTGTHVPLAIRWGAKVKGTRTIDDFVSLTDLAPTFLQAAGLPIPKEMTGRSLLEILTTKKSGLIDETRNFVITGMEQHVYPNPSRAIRNGEFLYIRNYEPGNWKTGDHGGPQVKIDFTKELWPTHEGAFSFNIDPSPTKTFLLDNRSDEYVAPFFAAACGRRPQEELYDLIVDPAERNNVAQDKRYAAVKANLRNKLNDELRKSGDPRAGLVAENVGSFPIDFSLPQRKFVEKKLRGWNILIEQEMVEQSPTLAKAVLSRLDENLAKAVAVLPESALKDLRKVKLILYYGPRAEAGGQASGLEYFPADAPATRDGLDPRMGSSIVIFNAANYLRLTDEWAISTLVHEFGHAHHLEHWDSDRADIRDTWKRAIATGKYQTVHKDDIGKHNPNYAAHNHLEYFAELTAMYFAGSHYFPYDRERLAAYDPPGLALIERLWEVKQTSSPKRATITP